MIEERITQLFNLSLETKMAASSNLLEPIAKACTKLVNCLLNDGKILVCGNAGSAANCLHFTASLLNYVEVERPALPVFSLISDMAAVSAIASSSDYSQVFARQISALGKQGDLLLLLSATGNHDSLLNALDAANERGMDSIALSGNDGGILAAHLGPEDIEIRVASNHAARIKEMHLFILHCFADLIDRSLFGQM